MSSMSEADSGSSPSSRAPLRVLVAMDKYKGTLTSSLANEAVSRALKASLGADAVSVDLCATSDGGDGFVAALVEPLGLTVVQQEVRGPLGAPVTASWAHDGRGTAYIEMATASGIALIAPEDRNPLKTSTYGTGQLMRAAWHDVGCSRIVLGIGGSATNDGGLGALAALGVRVLLRPEDGGDDGSKLIEAKPEDICGAVLGRVARLELPAEPLCPAGAEVLICCDVRTPFCGPTGATYTFGPQKGAKTPECLATLEAGMQNLSHAFLHSVDGVEGAGAAGGISGGLLGTFGTDVVHLEPGFAFVSRALGLPERAARAELLVTGEGAMDDTTAEGKTVACMLDLARRSGNACAILCGHVEEPAEAVARKQGATVVSALDRRFPLNVCMTETAKCIETVVADDIVPLCRKLMSTK